MRTIKFGIFGIIFLGFFLTGCGCLPGPVGAVTSSIWDGIWFASNHFSTRFWQVLATSEWWVFVMILGIFFLVLISPIRKAGTIAFILCVPGMVITTIIIRLACHWLNFLGDLRKKYLEWMKKPIIEKSDFTFRDIIFGIPGSMILSLCIHWIAEYFKIPWAYIGLGIIGCIACIVWSINKAAGGKEQGKAARSVAFKKLGLVLYFITHMKVKGTWKCACCKKTYPSDMEHRYCEEGTLNPDADYFCECGQLNPAKNKTCSKCGTPRPAEYETATTTPVKKVKGKKVKCSECAAEYNTADSPTCPYCKVRADESTVATPPTPTRSPKFKRDWKLFLDE